MEEIKRLDTLLADISGYSREFCKTLIIEKKVSVNSKIITKAGTKIKSDSIINYELPKTIYVSRGGYKLEKALKVFNIDIKDKICLDIGASTGGFTDCMLQNFAKKIFAVDTGTEQLDKSLKNNSCVISFEKTNINDFKTAEKINFITVDVSFVSIKKIMPSIFSFFSEDTKAVFLIKPQFEAGKEFLNKKGLIKDKKIHLKVIKDIYNETLNYGFFPADIDTSPIDGGDGNKEFLMYFDNSLENNITLKENFFRKLNYF